jgi:hypothetical protein
LIRLGIGGNRWTRDVLQQFIAALSARRVVDDWPPLSLSLNGSMQRGGDANLEQLMRLLRSLPCRFSQLHVGHLPIRAPNSQSHEHLSAWLRRPQLFATLTELDLSYCDMTNADFLFVLDELHAAVNATQPNARRLSLSLFGNDRVGAFKSANTGDGTDDDVLHFAARFRDSCGVLGMLDLSCSLFVNDDHEQPDPKLRKELVTDQDARSHLISAWKAGHGPNAACSVTYKPLSAKTFVLYCD